MDALGPFPDPHPKWMGCGHTTAQDHTGQPHMAVGAQTPGAPWEAADLPGAQSIRLRPESSLLWAKITQGGGGWCLAAHNRDWIKDRGQCTSVLGQAVH